VDTNLQSIGQARTRISNNDRRGSGRRSVGVPGRIIWHDSRGTPRFSSVVTHDVSSCAAYVECLSGPPIPLHRLVYLQLDRTMRGFDFLPAALKQGKVLSAVCRVGAVSNVTGLPDGYALRLLIEPQQQMVAPIPNDVLSQSDESLALPA
jgi:hypothetical protein